MSGMGTNGANQTDNGHIEKMNAFLDRVTEEIVGLREKKMVREEMTLRTRHLSSWTRE